jgi:hypothetical protein
VADRNVAAARQAYAMVAAQLAPATVIPDPTAELRPC